MTRPLTLWLLGDGKAGHENQALGLAEALGRRTPCSIHRIALAGAHGLLGRLRETLRACAGLSRPDLILGAGHATHFPLLWLARKHRAKSLVLMRPSLPLRWFDLCLAPAHDFPNGCLRSNVILTCGALNRVAPPATTAERNNHMMLIGGPSATHGWNAPQLLHALTEITAQGTWQLTNSRRTPAGFLDVIHQCLPAIEVYSYQETPPDWLPAKLATADTVWVTEDSVSMIYEALSSGARVGLLPAPRLMPSARVLRGLEELAADGFLTTFAGWQQTHQLNTPPTTLREADRCAAEVIGRLFEQRIRLAGVEPGP